MKEPILLTISRGMFAVSSLVFFLSVCIATGASIGIALSHPVPLAFWKVALISLSAGIVIFLINTIFDKKDCHEQDA